MSNGSLQPRSGRIDPRKLVYFAEVVERGSVNKAAKALGISQPALSTSMDRLESDVGLAILERSPTGVAPTAIGEVLYAHARLIRDELDLAQHRLAAKNDDNVNSIAFGTLEAVMDLSAGLIHPLLDEHLPQAISVRCQR